MQRLLSLACLGMLIVLLPVLSQDKKDPPKKLNVNPPHVSTDKSIKIDYDIVYVRAPRHGDEKRGKWAEFSDPTRMEPGADLMLLHPDGSEELLVSGKGGSVMDPYVSFDAQWVYYAKFIDDKHSGSDIHKIHLKTKKIVKLTDQTFTPNLGAAPWSKDFRTPEKDKTTLRYGVYNLGPCPAPGGKVVFTSNRNAYVPPRGYPKYTMQLFVMDDAPAKPAGEQREPAGLNVDQIGYLNIACALHPVILTDGRICYSTLESHGSHNSILWGIWSIHPDGTNWEPVVSAYWTGGAPPAFHFQSQLADKSIVVEQYYNLNNSGFGTFLKMPLRPPQGVPGFGPGDLKDPRNAAQRYGGHQFRMPFTTTGIQVLTKFAYGEDGPAQSSIPGEQVKSKQHGGTAYPHALGKVTHPCGAPDNHLLTVWTPGPANHQYNYFPYIDSGIYLIKDGQPIDEPGQMLLIKNDPKYNEQWPRPVVPYKRIYGIDEPKTLVHKNDGKASPHLPEGTPYGLVGTSSMYKRESAPGGYVPKGSVTAVPSDPKRMTMNWSLQGADAGIYDNTEIHAIRIVAQEPRTDIKGTGHGGAPLYGNHAMERLRILGEIPVRHFLPPRESGEPTQPLDPDGNPDTSFLAKIPANQSFTFQTIDKHGMVLNFAQTWHQLRPGEIRNDCGGCHAHSQQPTPFEKTMAASKAYKIFDLTHETPLLTTKANDQSKRQWDVKNETGLRYTKGLLNVEYYRDIRPIFERSCVACHSHKNEKPAADLILDDDHVKSYPAFGHDAGPDVRVPQTYFRLAVGGERFKSREIGLPQQAVSRYITRFQSRRSLLVWKLFGKRMDGLTNETFPSLAVRNDAKSLHIAGKPVPKVDYSDEQKLRGWIRDNGIDIDYQGSIMPPPDAVKSGKVAPLSDEDRRMIIRWIDLGCPIDLDPDWNAKAANTKSYGWHGDDQRPTLTVTYPAPGRNESLRRILIGMHDTYSGIDPGTFEVIADFPAVGVKAGQNLASKFRPVSQGVWELVLEQPIPKLESGRLTVSVKDRQGNQSRLERSFSVGR